MIEEMSVLRTILLVDDEPNIISALKRTLRRDGYRILTAHSAEEGLNLLIDNDVGVIISDQRMPQMTGVEFLRKVKELYPKTIRLVLSGYTELESVTNAINEGAIFKFLTKPWDDELLLKNVRESFEYYEMELENQRLTKELADSNEKLFRLNQNLEQQVQQKTREIVHNMTMLKVSQEILENLPIAIIGVDNHNMIATSNRCADRLFPHHQGSCLLGLQANELLPDALIQQLQNATLQGEHAMGPQRIQLEDGRTLQVWISAMGDFSQSKGTVVMLMPSGGS
ncbi:response regulator [Methylomonas sp. AM2-LC]|uniref:response regulator n=1 Tax=Methylomonas sp. AM2-LC TaxID=3153301 RepID=UPI0032672568